MSKQSAVLIKTKNIIRILVAVIIILAFLAGFFHSAWQTEQRKTEHLKQQLEEIKE